MFRIISSRTSSKTIPSGTGWHLNATLVMKDNSPFLWTTIVAMYDIVLKVDGEQPGLLIRHGSPAIERAFANTRWAGGAWQKALRKLPGYFAPKNPVQFPASGTKARATGMYSLLYPEKLPMNASDRY